MRAVVRVIAAVAVATALAGAAPSHGETAPIEYQVKASYLYNFIQFTTWPADVFGANGKFNLCIVGAERFGTALDPLRSEHVNRHEIVVHRLADAGQAQDRRCHLLFIAALEAGPAPALTPERGRLTIGETPGFLTRGGIINLVDSGGRIRFEINQQAAREAGLVLSSRLLKLAVPP